MSHFLEVDSILKSYDDRLILSDVYMTCKTGDIIAIFGRNGCGKSTLFKVLFGVLEAENRFLRIDGNVIVGKAYKTGLLSYLPQDNYLPKEMKVVDLINLVCVTKPPVWLNDPLVQRITTRKVRDLSGGESRYLQILLMLEWDAPFVILDEPFYGIAPVIVDEICKYIRYYAVNKGIILADHNYSQAYEIANRFMLLHDGCLRSITDMEALKGVYLK